LKGDIRMKTVNKIFEILGTAAGNKVCGSSTEDKLHISDVQSMAKIERNELTDALQLICSHQKKWMINLFSGENNIIDDCTKLSEVTYMSSQQAFLSITCRLKRAVFKILMYTLMAVFSVLFGWCCYLYYKHSQKKKQQLNQQMFRFVNEIIGVVKRQHDLSETDETVDPFIPIIQARDIIIDAQNRGRMSRAWKMAVDWVASENESRLRVETQRVKGQDHIVWRWIQVKSPVKQHNNSNNFSFKTPNGSFNQSATSKSDFIQSQTRRIWQGEAFVTNNHFNAPNISPSSCLKIRNVFNAESERKDNWEHEIKDAILEKCSNCTNILSINVEKNSTEGLVYVRCSTNEEAGKVFSQLHGAWFDGRLLTVKFLKLRRFQERYPHQAGPLAPMKHFHPNKVSTVSPLPSAPSN